MTASATLDGASPSPTRVLVTAVTGRQGGSLARLLVRRGHRVRGLTRKPEGPAAQALRQLGVEIVAGGFEDPHSVEQAARNCDAAYVVATPFEKGPEFEARAAISAMDAARAGGVPYIVYSSVADADRHTGIPHFESKARAERHLEQMGVDYAIVAPVFFMENLAAPWMAPGLAKGALAMALPATRKLQSVAVRDIGRFSALAVEQRAAFRGKRVNIAGDELTPEEMASRLSVPTGRKVTFQRVPLEAVRQQSEDAAKMYEWFDRVGYSADIPGLKKAYPAVQWLSLDAWAASVDWAQALSGGKPAPA